VRTLRLSPASKIAVRARQYVHKMNTALADTRECAAAKRLVEEELTAAMRIARLSGSTVREVGDAAGVSTGKVHGLTAVEGVIARALSVPGNVPVVRRLALISGGGDSTVLAHRCRDIVDELAHLDTGTALPGVREFVEDFARSLGLPLRIVEANGAFREMVLGADEWWKLYVEHKRRGERPDTYRRRVARFKTRDERMALLHNRAPLGFPGPAGHRFAYQRLKERQLERIVRDVRQEFGGGRVMLLSGVRIAESHRRKMTGTAQGAWERRGNQVWVNPLLDWSNAEMAEYRREHELPVSDVTALTHRSGECNCLAFASKGEPEFLVAMYPDWFAENIEPLQAAARERGLERCDWGWGAGEPPMGSVGPLCQGCEAARWSSVDVSNAPR
jgi:3'-phosphoadenosine 5'-phosphosulfate sulfotransferase (PAPS reductase)/FAD synthetase